MPTQPQKDTKWIYSFGEGCVAPPLDRNLLGGKGKGTAEMSSMGIPVPPGFIITTEACVYFRANKHTFPPNLEKMVDESMVTLEGQMKSKFGDKENPLLISVRSGARISMPGMMDTVLDLGMNDGNVEGFAKAMKSDRMAWDSYRRFISMYSNVVCEVDSSNFEHALEAAKKAENVKHDVDLSVDALKKLTGEYQKIFKEKVGKDFPQEPKEQLYNAIRAVFQSWDNPRATAYRRFHSYPDTWGTAVVVMSMVFGNRGDDSATGVGFTRDPATGQKQFYGEFLVNAQGEDVVAGVRTPQPINKAQKEMTGSTLASLEEVMPEVYKELAGVAEKLEKHFHEMQDVEFTIDQGRLFMLQTRTGKRTGFAAVKIACDMLDEGLIDEKEALTRIDPAQMTQLLTPVFDSKDKAAASDNMVARGLNAGPGAASGVAVFSSQAAVEKKKKGIKCILIREETSPEDFEGMVAAEGILTARGGATSHAAVVARGLGKSCICGCGDLSIDHEKKMATVANGKTIKEGDDLSMDGTVGQVFLCKLDTKPSEIIQVLVDKTRKAEECPVYKQFERIMSLCDKYTKLGVKTNADTPHDSHVARMMGAKGIGLVRTEHMFMDKARLMDVRCMMFSEDEAKRKEAVEKLLPYQKEDFLGIFRVMDGYSVTIRLLDPPKHEFLPHKEEEYKQLAEKMGVSREKLATICDASKEQNPMLGHRGCRLGVTYPYLTEMQVRAIIQAAVQASEEGKKVIPEIMVPLISSAKEMEHQKLVIDATAKKVFEEMKKTVSYKVGCMIEIPRAALRAEQIARYCDFFSFGTNDLTQCTYGLSRDDSGSFLPLYIQGVDFPGEGSQQVFEFEPFQTLDQDGVGELMLLARERGRKTNSNLVLGICGEHGGEGKSVKYCHVLGLDYVSCSPFRVPVARLAAAQAAIEEK